ncbi:helix-turn-helix domain-containing protein [Streptomyces sp. NPDC093094]|uniref:AraC-like ligand-binding domain-containing protein n=1 Tax=Streptomyces sp. NPDC093094 TaxID=3366026 RepID=UPI00380A6254
MLVNEYRTDVVPAAERWELWHDIVSRTHTPNLLRSERDDDFRAVMRVLTLGEVQVARLAFPDLESVRTPRAIRRSDPEVYQIVCPYTGTGRIAHNGRQSAFGPGDLVVVDSSLPYEARFVPSGTGTHSTCVVVTLPRSLLSLPPRTLRKVLAVPIPVGRGIGGALHRWLADLTARAGEFEEADAATLGGVTTALLTSVLGHALEAEDAMSPESRRRALHTRALDFIDRNLGDPSLSPASVAAAHGVSVRHLHQLFAEGGATPAAWIRHRRLEHCRRDLADPGLRSRPIAALAARWGFRDPAAFSRQFRRAYGVSPRDYRHHP